MEKYNSIRLPLGYLPPLAWFYMAEKYGNVEVEAHENYQKSSIRNRCQIAGPNGKQLLSIPLFKGKHQQTPIQNVKISNVEGWQRKHWRGIQTAYGSAPFFMHFEHELEPFFTNEHDSLFDFNRSLLKKVMNLMGMSFYVSFSEKYEIDGDTIDGRVFFEKGGIIPEEFKTDYYPQVFESSHGFLPNLSVLDALFCCGSLPKK